MKSDRATRDQVTVCWLVRRSLPDCTAVPAVGGRPLRVNEAQDKPRSGGGARSGGGFRGGGRRY